jgi:hypothetical protein
MKNILLLSFLLLSLLACKKKHISPDGPTDIRVRNLSDLTFTDVIVSTSEKQGDTLALGDINSGYESGFVRFKKAYPKAQISAKIMYGGSLVEFSTGPVDYTYMQYIGQDKITYEVYISNPTSHVLTISNVIEEEPLSLK